jgi:RNA polymerase sigma-70 factor (ECF subfamily)
MSSHHSVGNISERSTFQKANDEFLVNAARSGEDWAFSELWHRHSKKIFNTMYRVTRNRQDAEDALQDAFFKAFLHLKNFDGRSSFSTWLTRIAINSALMILRKKRSHPEVSMDCSGDGETWQNWEIADSRVNTEESYVRRERDRHLKRAIHRLRPALRNVIEIQQAHEGSVREIAEMEGISIAATKSRLLRARTLLRRALRACDSRQLDPTSAAFN